MPRLLQLALSLHPPLALPATVARAHLDLGLPLDVKGGVADAAVLARRVARLRGQGPAGGSVNRWQQQLTPCCASALRPATPPCSASVRQATPARPTSYPTLLAAAYLSGVVGKLAVAQAVGVTCGSVAGSSSNTANSWRQLFISSRARVQASAAPALTLQHAGGGHAHSRWRRTQGIHGKPLHASAQHRRSRTPANIKYARGKGTKSLKDWS